MGEALGLPMYTIVRPCTGTLIPGLQTGRIAAGRVWGWGFIPHTSIMYMDRLNPPRPRPLID